MEFSGQLHAPSVLPRKKKTRYPLNGMWVSEKRKRLAPPGVQTLPLPTRSLVSIPTTLIPARTEEKCACWYACRVKAIPL